MSAQTVRTYTKTPHRVPDVVASAQRLRAAELELMHDLMRELQQGNQRAVPEAIV